MTEENCVWENLHKKKIIILKKCMTLKTNMRQTTETLLSSWFQQIYFDSKILAWSSLI